MLSHFNTIIFLNKDSFRFLLCYLSQHILRQPEEMTISDSIIKMYTKWHMCYFCDGGVFDSLKRAYALVCPELCKNNKQNIELFHPRKNSQIKHCFCQICSFTKIIFLWSIDTKIK
ncbi:hypothetical protein M153_8800018989 [Pseudoloma neurophilia]|uniref:Uncharacterized protein n=1 Tax=Pseudoloma neurophilia TaxID=146866 RepID=A0A0R0M6D5_9MICR|nr:hypothetical protein M153_8800018989 [Pseudoloma neurophilia]